MLRTTAILLALTPAIEPHGGGGAVTLDKGHLTARIPDSPGFLWVEVKR